MSALRPFFVLLSLVMACGATQRQPMPDPLEGITGDELYNRGVGFARGGDLLRAEQYFVAAMEKGKPRAEVLPLLLQVCVGSERYSSALTYAEPALRDHPSDWRLRLIVGSIYGGLGRVEDARHSYHAVLEQHPESASAHYFLSALYLDDLQDWERAQQHLEGYLELEPTGVHAEEVRASLAAGAPSPIERIEHIVSEDPSGDEPQPTTESTESTESTRIEEPGEVS